MLPPRGRVTLLVFLALMVALSIVGARWLFSVPKFKDSLELQRQLNVLWRQIEEHRNKEIVALDQIRNCARNIKSSQNQYEHVKEFGTRPHWEYYLREIEDIKQVAAENRKLAAEERRMRQDLEDTYYKLWDSIPRDLREPMQLSPGN